MWLCARYLIYRNATDLAKRLDSQKDLREVCDNALTGCRMTLAALNMEVGKLVEPTQSGKTGKLKVAFKAKARTLWKEDVMKGLLDHTRGEDTWDHCTCSFFCSWIIDKWRTNHLNLVGLQRESTRNSETREAERNALNLLLHKANSIRSSRAGPDWLWTDERFSEMCNQSKLKSGFLECIKKVAGRVTEAERLLIVVCAQGADSDDVQKAGYGLKGDLLPHWIWWEWWAAVTQPTFTPQGNSRSEGRSCDIINHQLLRRSLISQYILIAGASSKESLAFPASGSGRARGGILIAALTSTLADEWGQQLPNGVVGVTIWVQTRPISSTKMFYLAQAYVEAGTRFACLLWPSPSAAAAIYLCRLDIIKDVITPAATHPT